MVAGNRGETHGTILSQITQTDFEKRISYVLGSCDVHREQSMKTEKPTRCNN